MRKSIVTKFVVATFATAMFAVPAFAATDESRNNDTMNQLPVIEQGMFKAVQELPGQSNEMSDAELARVEGGFHEATAGAYFGAAFLFALQHDFWGAANAGVTGALIGNITHP